MKRRFLQSGATVMLALAGLLMVTARRDASGGSKHPYANTSAATSQTTGKESARPYYFSPAYDYCYVDSDGRPIVFHRKRLVFFFPDSPPEVNDRTFIETDSCQ
jgi:hypothetical protein